jgi:hypothetical protein
MKDEKQIIYDSPEAASYRTNIEGWVSSFGRFWGMDEHMARWEGCTHQRCNCGNLMSKNYTKCDDCIEKGNRERYNALPVKEWEGEFLYSHSADKYFFNDDDVMEYLEEEETDFNSLRMVVCEPNYLGTIELDSSEFPEDQEYEDVVDKSLRDMVDALNLKIREHKPISYSPGKVRVTFNNVQNVQVSDTIVDDSSTSAKYKKK